MKKTHISKLFMVLAALAVLGLVSSAYAYKGYGNRGGQEEGTGYGCPFYTGVLSEDEVKKLDEARKAFFDATEELRGSIYEKEVELGNELAKADTDAEKVIALQTELSELRAKFDQERVQHLIKIKEINPKLGRNFQGGIRGGCGAYSGGYGCGGAGAGCAGRGAYGGGKPCTR
jgi:hypothetical protein